MKQEESLDIYDGYTKFIRPQLVEEGKLDCADGNEEDEMFELPKKKPQPKDEPQEGGDE